MKIDVVPFGDTDEAAIRQAYEISRASNLHEMPDVPPSSAHTFISGIRQPHPGYAFERAIGYLDGQPAGYLSLEMPELDNLDNAAIDLSVTPSRSTGNRRRSTRTGCATPSSSGWTADSAGSTAASSISAAAGSLPGPPCPARPTPRRTWQNITIVDPTHRGHRLGMIVKLENLRHAREHRPELTAVDTSNAASNAHMLAINVAMGFRAVDSWMQWQQTV